MSEDLKSIRVCVDKVVPFDLQPKAEEVAVAENPKNAPNADPNVNKRLALMTRKMWQTGRTLRVSFLDGDEVMRGGSRSTRASGWTTPTSSSISWTTRTPKSASRSWPTRARGRPSAPTRSFRRPSGSRGWPTMNFGWLTPDTDDEEYSRVVVHEFGDALGCLHEHQGPKANVQWNKPVVYRYFEETQGWTKEDVDFNLFDRYHEEETQFTEFDPESIMIYHIPPEFTLDGASYPTNVRLSQTDKDFISQQYPSS